MTDLIRWVEDSHAEAAYLGRWYLGAIFTVDERHFVMSMNLPDQGSHRRTSHSTREGCKSFAEQRVRDFLAWAELPGRI